MSSTASKKRKPEEDSLALLPSKRPKTGNDDDSQELISLPTKSGLDSNRTSNLKAPTMLLTGHQSEVLSARFSRKGQFLATGSRDRQVFLWNVYGDCENFMVLKGHKNAVVQAEWSPDDSQIVTGSTDKTLGIWDVTTGRRLLKLSEHEKYVNAISLGRRDAHKIASVGDDAICYLWDYRSKRSSLMLQTRYPLTSVALLDERNLVFTGGIDNTIGAWDIRKASGTPAWLLNGALDSITSLRIDPEGSFLLSNSMDNIARIWDIRAFAPEQRCLKSFAGAVHGIDKTLIRANWSADGALIGSGSADHQVYVWDTMSKNIKYRLPGHIGTVSEVDFHPKEPIIASAGTDKQIFLGEIESE